MKGHIVKTNLFSRQKIKLGQLKVGDTFRTINSQIPYMIISIPQDHLVHDSQDLVFAVELISGIVRQTQRDGEAYQIELEAHEVVRFGSEVEDQNGNPQAKS